VKTVHPNPVTQDSAKKIQEEIIWEEKHQKRRNLSQDVEVLTMRMKLRNTDVKCHEETVKISVTIAVENYTVKVRPHREEGVVQ
jgi:hypothetical protein